MEQCEQSHEAGKDGIDDLCGLSAIYDKENSYDGHQICQTGHKSHHPNGRRALLGNYALTPECGKGIN